MKTRSTLFGIALATLLMAGCQDETNISGNSSDQPGSATGYVKLSINMPATVGTRADGTYDNGIADEYKVNDACILFFKGKEDASATFLGAYEMNLSMNNANTDGGQITTTSAAYIMEAPIGAESALVIINPDNTLLTLDANTHMLSIGGIALTTDSKLEDLQGVLTAEVDKFTGNSKNDFTMTNAPLSDLSGSDNDLANAKATTLAPVTVYESKTQANAATADQIYVERVVAKVSMDVSSTILANNEEGKTVINVDFTGPYTGDQVILEGWALNVTNKTTKLVRSVSGFSTWVNYNTGERFVENNPVKTGVGKYRINWATDNNYENATVNTDFNTCTTEPIAWNTTWTTASGADYCLENTFTAAQMLQDRTTQVLIKTTYKRGGTATNFIVVEGWNSGAISTDNFIERLKKEISGLTDKNISIKTEADGGYYNKAGYKMLKDLLTVEGYTGTDLDKVIESLGTVKFYKNGASYYSTALIRHFGDSETPWNNGEEYNEAKHLGRYGVVRNTWYQLNIRSIAGPGEPEIPELPGEPDDQQEAYIKVQVNILAWAVRQNDIDL